MLLILAGFVAFGYALTSHGKDVIMERATAKSLIPRWVWACAELYDLYKDLKILFSYAHVYNAKWVMIYSIVLPFTISDAITSSKNLIHNFIVHIGFTKTLMDLQARSYALLTISFIENIPQFLTVVYEMITYRKTINFVQASNPLYSILMIYRAVGPFIGKGLYVEFISDEGTPIMKIFLAFLVILTISPLIYISHMI